MNKQIRLFISILAFLLGSITSLAGIRTEREMVSIASAKLAAMGGLTRAETSVRKLIDKERFSVYTQGAAGFVVVSRDDALPPVLAYSDSSIDPDDLPCGFEWWMRAVDMSASAKSALPLRVNRTAPLFSEPVGPLLQTQWGQDDPYNMLCPIYKGERAPTGCVATAVSQIMKYFEYPAQGKGNGYYQLGGTAGRVPENISSVYEWDKMIDRYKGAKHVTEEQRLAVATLMKEVGLASHMDYNETGSAAYSLVASYGLCINFGYDSLALRFLLRDYYSNHEWMETIYKELSARRPILYGANDAGVGGHSFVFDGYDADGLVHVNWGWDGKADGYYNVSDLAPVLNPISGPTEHYILDQAMVIGFKCQETPDPDEQYKSSIVIIGDYRLEFQKSYVRVKSDYFANLSFLCFYGSIGVYFKSAEGKDEHNMYVPIKIKARELQTIAPNYLNDGISAMTITGSIAPGNYVVYLASKAIQETEPSPIRVPGGPICYYVTVHEDGSKEASEPQPLASSISNITYADKTSAIYNLAGQRQQQLRKGINIVDGKKIWMK